jgi:signal transduction histidine kinase
VRRPGEILRTATFRLTFAHLAAFGLVVAILLAFVYLRTVNELGRQVEEVVARDVARLLETYEGEGTTGLMAVVDRESRGTGLRLYLLTDGQLQRLAGNLMRWPPDLPIVDGQHRFSTEGAEAVPDRSRPAQGTVTTLSDGTRLLVARDLSERQAFRSLIAGSIGWALALSLLLGAIEGWLLSRFMLRRVDALHRFSVGVSAGDMLARLPVRGTGDEFDRLSIEINGLLEKIEHLVRGHRELTDSVAHDLRRPFTRLKGRLELLLSREHDLDACRRVAAESVEEANGILHTFDLLLRIAKAESGVVEEQFARLDLGTTVKEVVELYAPLAREKSIALEAGSAEPATINGLRELLAQAISNLVDNAIKFSSPGSAVRIRVTTDGRAFVLEVADHGPGIPEVYRERVLQRFVRLDASRSQPGSGLGLALVAATARLHKAELELADNHPGLRVVMRFPRAGQL